MVSRSALIGFLLLAAVTAASFVGAAAPSAKVPAKDAQATIEPPSEPGAGQAFLKTFEGDWAVDNAPH